MKNEQRTTRVNLNNLPEELQNQINDGYSQIACVEITGDSMMPTIHHGGRAIIDMGKKEIENGYAYVFEKHNLYPSSDMYSWIKRLHIEEDGGLKIVSENAKYTPFHFKSIEDIKVIGKVVAVAKPGSDGFYSIDNVYTEQYFVPIIKDYQDLQKFIKNK